MFDVGGAELILILLAVLVLFGPKKIPEVAKMMGKGMQKIKDAQGQFQEQMRNIQQEINTPVPPVNKTVPPPTTDHIMSETAKTIAEISDVPTVSDDDKEVKSVESESESKDKTDSDKKDDSSENKENKENSLPKEIINTRSNNRSKSDPPNKIEM